MKVLLINGSPRPKGCTYTALTEIAGRFSELGVESELIQTGKKAIQDCIDCRKCAKTGKCIFNDDPVNETVEKLKQADGLIIGAPVYYAGPSARLCAFMDRLFFMKTKDFAGKPAAAIVSCRRGGASASFDRLNKYFTICGMPVVSSQYWNSVHGNTPEEVRQDLEGLQTMRTLASNMTWLMQCIEAGRRAGITYPEPEPWIATNFIR
ncbi:MAG: flavodoxin family protein [Desulfovibrionaceae bacterium]|nr:flavodoxin family protein [Desulfovibrionaceae bacterium]